MSSIKIGLLLLFLGVAMIAAGIFYGTFFWSIVGIAGGLLLGWQLPQFYKRGLAAGQDESLMNPPLIDSAVQDGAQTALEDDRQIAVALADLTQIINATLEPNQVLNISLEQLSHLIPFDTAAILFKEDTNLRVAAYRALANPQDLVHHTFSLNENRLFRRVMQSLEGQVVADVVQIEGWQGSFGQGEATDSTHAWLGVPLVVQGKSIGIITLNKAEPNFYTDRAREVVTKFAAQIAAAVQNARLFDRLRHQALEVAVMADNLTQEKHKLDGIIKHIADGLVVTDAEGMIQLVNPAFEDMVEQPMALLVDQNLEQFEALHQLVTDVLAGVALGFTVDIAFSEGQILKASAALIEEEAKILGVVTVLRDITREKEVDRMKSEFISTVSHELRTPLTSVLGFAQHINKTFHRNIVSKIADDDRKGQRAIRHITEELGIIVTEGERLTRLINEVLDIAKMEAGKLEWQMADVAIDEVIKSAVSTTHSLGRDKGLGVTVEIKEHLPLIWGDQDRLIQVVTNLLSNAIKFTDEGQIRIEATNIEVLDDKSVVPETEDFQYADFLEAGYWLIVAVQDTGVGISTENLPFVFEKFKQVGDVLTDRPSGTGLGVPICKEIIEQHGGHIWVDSQLGTGTTFTFSLPLVPDVAAKPLFPDEIRRQMFDTLQDVKHGYRILVVDDEPNIRNLLRHELSEAGYEVIEAGDGLEAVAIARQEKPDLIILDVMMPGLNGFDVTSILKGDQSTGHIPILILSIVEDRETGFRLGAEEYLTKPLLNADQLLESIARLLAQAEHASSRKKVLVIDEDMTVVASIGELLQARGYGVVGASSEEDGLKKIRQEKPDLIVLNTPTSKMNDYEMLKNIQYEPGTSNAPVIVLTNTISPEQVVEILDQSMNTES